MGKKLILILTAVVMAVALSACGSFGGGSNEETPNESEKATQTPEDKQVAPEQASEQTTVENRLEAPEDTTLTLEVPKMERVKGVEIPNGLGTDEELLRNNAAIHLEGTGYPWQEEANVYIAGHRLGYADTGSYLAFYDIDKLQNGDEIYVTDAEGRKYTYEVFKEMVVEPTDLYVLDPIEGKNIISLQACTLPDYSNRIIVQAELKDVAA
jgi:sortase A